MNKNLLNKKYGIWWLFLTFITFGLNIFYLAYLLDLYDEDAWYSNYKYWFAGLFLIIPGILMMCFFIIQMTVKVSAELNVPGKEIYSSVYLWILLFIIPFLGWTTLMLMAAYITIMPSVQIIRGKAN